MKQNKYLRITKTDMHKRKQPITYKADQHYALQGDIASGRPCDWTPSIDKQIMKTLHFLHKYSIEVLTLHCHSNKIKFLRFKHHKHPSLDKMIKKNEYHNLLKIITNFNSSPFLHNLNNLKRTEHYIIKDKRTTHYFTF